MRNLKVKLFFVAFIFITLNNFCSAQTYGKIYTKTEADNIYGDVLFSKIISTSEVKSLILKTENVLLFNFIDNKLYFLDSKRNSITSESIEFRSDVVFKVVSLSVLSELLEKGGESVTTFEQRKNVVSITNGAYTLEYVSVCPPVCF